MSGCHRNIMEKWTSDLTTHLNWTAPSFSDPVGKPIKISSNYPTNSYKFPWGDFAVHYVALKPSNGMRTTCVFSWKIRRELFNTKLIYVKNCNLKLNKYVNLLLSLRYFFSTENLRYFPSITTAYPCKPLSLPKNGALVCNGWSKDYGQFCLVFCGPQYSLDIQSSHYQWHVCGASGKWIPQERLPNCTGIFWSKYYFAPVSFPVISYV